MKFVKIYKVDNETKNPVGIINRNNFKKSLYQVKFLFSNKNELNNFANNMFKDMGINDDNDHNIVPIHQYDHIIVDYDIDKKIEQLEIITKINKKIGGNIKQKSNIILIINILTILIIFIGTQYLLKIQYFQNTIFSK